MSENLLDVLVVGAGPVGLFCANELLRQGLRCRIIDKKSEITSHSKALGIHIRSLDLLEDCGFLDEIFTQGLKVDGVMIKSHGKELINASFADLENNRHFLIDLPQNKTERIFYNGLLSKGLEVEWNTELTELEQTANKVIATLQRTDGSQEKINASWLIACDGSHSTVRQLLYAKFVGSSYQQTFWLADIHMDWDLPENKIIVYASDKGPLACFPMGEQRYRLVMTAPEKITHQQPTMEDIKELFNLRSTDKATLSDGIWISPFGIDHRQIEKYRYDRVFFAGDAAHVHSPMGGQGMNTGLQDIYNLAWKLALVHKGFAHEKLLDSYQSERRPVAKKVLKKTGAMTRMLMLSHPFLIGLRNKFLKSVISIKPIRRIILKDLAELDISYADSPIVKILGKKTGFKIGEFIDNFSLRDSHGKKKQFHQITQGTQHHLFLFSGLGNNQLSTLLDTALSIGQQYQGLIQTHLVLLNPTKDAFQSHLVWIDTDQTIHKKFGLMQSTAILIRPDKYLGLSQTPVNQEELLRHLKNGYINKAG
ncbi:FAD dependent oxidoreductase [Legionella nautarum]|uniref:FAD dependent oxidoreductase n=1 Tax=Legionella nautarum TaxID=45070 RepID=A0A0W0WRZ7_9GAMM|nr:FAD-dependent monooxygenase [Legionella nautarum]KTD35098.1 FAD dependent oxidoreductase [Legionella nautarum]